MCRTLLLIMAALSLVANLPSWAQSPGERLKIGVSVRTTFAHNYGDRPQAVLYEGQSYSMAEAPQALLPRFGWDNVAWRTELALTWVQEVELIGISQHKEPAPTARLNDDGSVDVRVWIRVPTGNHPPRSAFCEYRFAPDASLTQRVLENVRD